MIPTIEAFDHIHVYVKDRASAVQWYAQAMGMHPVAELASWAVDGGPLTIANASGTVHIALFERTTDKCISTIALRVTASSFRDWQTHLASALGREIKAVDHQLSWSLYFADPDGNPYEITTYEYQQISAAL